MTGYILIMVISTGYHLMLSPTTGLAVRDYETPRIEIKRGYKDIRECRTAKRAVMESRKDVIAECAEDYST